MRFVAQTPMYRRHAVRSIKRLYLAIDATHSVLRRKAGRRCILLCHFGRRTFIRPSCFSPNVAPLLGAVNRTAGCRTLSVQQHSTTVPQNKCKNTYPGTCPRAQTSQIYPLPLGGAGDAGRDAKFPSTGSLRKLLAPLPNCGNPQLRATRAYASRTGFSACCRPASSSDSLSGSVCVLFGKATGKSANAVNTD